MLALPLACSGLALTSGTGGWHFHPVVNFRGGGAQCSTRVNPPQPTRRSANRNWFQQRTAQDSASLRRNKRAPRASRWEREADELYAEISIDPSITFRGLGPREREIAAERMLAELRMPQHSVQSGSLLSTPTAPPMWGSCSVGPVLKKQLLEAGLTAPLPIQEQAFAPISRRRNVVIASATGSGKTLAFLLPLLATTSRKSVCQVLFVVPSLELCAQLEREVDRLCPARAEASGVEGRKMLHVVRERRQPAASADGSCTEAELGGVDSDVALLEQLGQAPLLVGTPHTLLRLVLAAQPAERGGERAKLGLQAMERLRALRTVVLDEADQLLHTEELAATERWRRSQNRSLTVKERRAVKRAAKESACERLLRALPVRLTGDGSGAQLVCASATVSRTLRRQVQELVGAPSVDKAAELVAPAERSAKKEARNCLMPQTIRHRFVLWKPPLVEECGSVEEVAEPEAEGEATGASERGMENLQERAMFTALWDAMSTLPPAPTMIFASRRSGVQQTAEALRQIGLERVTILPSNEGQGKASDAAGSLHTEGSTWHYTPVYVASDRYGRGLDLNLSYVFMLAPPARSASYLHLAGRTGRQGTDGIAVTLATCLQVPRLVAFSSALGIGFEPLHESQYDGDVANGSDALADDDFMSHEA